MVIHEVKLKLKLEPSYYCLILKCSQSHKMSSNGVRDAQLREQDSIILRLHTNSGKARLRLWYPEP